MLYYEDIVFIVSAVHALSARCEKPIKANIRSCSHAHYILYTWLRIGLDIPVSWGQNPATSTGKNEAVPSSPQLDGSRVSSNTL